MRLLLALFLALGCLPGTGGYRVGEVDGADGGRADASMLDADADAGALDGSPRDADAGSATVADPCSPPVTCSGGCDKPWLLASVEDLPGSTTCGGRVWRWSLAGGPDEICACQAFDADGQLGELPFAVGFVPPETVVVADQLGTVIGIDGRTDTGLWSGSVGSLPADVFAIEDEAGSLLVGVPALMPTGYIQSLHFFDAATGRTGPVLTTADIPALQTAKSITQSPYDRRRMRVLKPLSSAHSAIDIQPFTGVVDDAPPHTRARMGFVLGTVSAMHDGVFHRTVFTGRQTELVGEPSFVFRISLGDDPGDNSVPLGDRCVSNVDGSTYDVECEYVHAVADPRSNLQSFAICAHEGGARRLVRVSVTTCSDVIEEASVYSSARLSKLAIGADDLWAP